MLVLTIAVFALNVWTSHTESAVSAVDEREHIDHLVQAADFQIPRNGAPLEQETLRELCERGSEYIKWPTRCPSGHLDPTKFSVGGVNIAGDPPLYYLVTAPPARALRAVMPFWDSLVTWGRILGSVWLLLAFYLVLRASDTLEIPRARMLAALLLITALPATLEATTTVTTDATAFASGAAVLLAALAWERTGRTKWLVALLAVAITAVVLKNTNAIGVLVVFVYFVLRAIAGARREGTGDERPWRHYALVGAALVVACVFGLRVVEKGIESLRAPIAEHAYTKAELRSKSRLDPLRSESGVDSFGITNVLGAQTLFGMFPPTSEIAAPIDRSAGDHAVWYDVAVRAATLLAIAALLFNVFGFSFGNRGTLIGVATVVALIAGGSLLVLYRRYVNDAVEVVVPRFGISALPAIAIVIAAVSKGRLAQWVVAGIAAGLFATALLVLV
jgi:hypothetical protein